MGFEVEDNGNNKHPNDDVLGQRSSRQQEEKSREERSERTTRDSRDNRDTRGRRRDDDRGQDDRESAARSLRNMNSMFSRPLDRRSSGEYLSKFSTTLNEIFHPEKGAPVAQSGGLQLAAFKVLPVDQSEYLTSISAAILILPLEQSDGMYVFAHTLVLEGSAPPPAPLQSEWQGRRYDVLQVSGDLWNEKFLQKVEKLCEAQYPNHKVLFNDCGCQVVSKDVDPTDAAMIRQIAFYATAALTTVSVEVLKYQERWALDLLDKRDTLDVHFDVSGEPIINASGQPRRSDVKMRLSASIYEDEGTIRQPLTVVGGQMELVYSPPKRDSGYGFGGRRDEETQHFYPVFNITTLDTEYKLVSMELALLGMAPVALLSENLRWVYAFRGSNARRGGKGNKDFRDIGALNLLVGGKYFDTKSANCSDEQFLDYFGTLTHADLAFGMHIEERGELTWVHQTFLEAAQGDEDAEDMIFDAADELTDGRFSRIYKEMGGGNPFDDGDNRIILGTYRDDEGNVRDLRDIDLLYLLNLSVERNSGDTDLALEYQDTFDMVELPISARIARRIDILESVLGGNITITGFARQVFIDPIFIRALAKAIHGCGATMNLVTQGSSYLNTRARGNNRIARYAGSNLGSGLFNTWGGGDNDRSNSNRPFMGRVRRWD